MEWIKRGLIYKPSGLNGFDISHCHKPTPLIVDEHTVRVFFGVRDKNGITRTTFVDLDSNNLSHVKYVHDKPVLDVGKIGAFDDSGANVSSVCRVGRYIYMYYIGWNPSTTVHTRNSIGLAVSTDEGRTFKRMFDGPVLDRNKIEPYYTGAVDVINENGSWKIWYTSGTEWKIIDGKPEIFYHIKYGRSENGIDWIRDDISCIMPENAFEVTARPCVVRDNDRYVMYYSKRNIDGFRFDKNKSYRPGYAESFDGIKWKRCDKKLGLETSETGWDSKAFAYPYVFKLKGKWMMLYNGNGFGKTGFGYAEKINR